MNEDVKNVVVGLLYSKTQEMSRQSLFAMCSRFYTVNKLTMLEIVGNTQATSCVCHRMLQTLYF